MTGLLLAWALAAAAAAPGGIQQPMLAVAVTDDRTPVVRVGPVLADEALRSALLSGLPLRLRFRVELWRDELIDELVSTERWSAVLTYDPLSRSYRLSRSLRGGAETPVADYAAARTAVEIAYEPPLRPRRPGRYYYIAGLEVETLSLTDLEELDRWLRGDLEPAVRGTRSLPSALGSGLRRLFVRMLGLPSREYEARSRRFFMPMRPNR